ncbi:unnamed protein product [Cuscuta campestris]|uniref:Retrotransposon gag domain-containing protein n=1 Tax=Cuscuta campestris TaxID=132261 RepID=A0A484KWH1_9ASTE|nr:unnamed protein product [Cuscuta campestris]
MLMMVDDGEDYDDDGSGRVILQGKGIGGICLSQPNYKKWSRLFLLLVRCFNLKGYIDGSVVPLFYDDNEWFQLDALVQGWILSTITDEVSDLVISSVSTASLLWKVIHYLFHDNKHARAMQLENEFRTTVKGNSTMAAYCQQLQNLADWLDDVDAPVSQHQLVLQMLRGLPADLQAQTSFMQFQDESLHVSAGSIRPHAAGSTTNESLRLGHHGVSHDRAGGNTKGGTHGGTPGGYGGQHGGIGYGEGNSGQRGGYGRGQGRGGGNRGRGVFGSRPDATIALELVPAVNFAGFSRKTLRPAGNRQLRDDLMTMLIAGHEAVLTWAVFLLSQKLKAQTELSPI